jgi:hypothetical protein
VGSGTPASDIMLRRAFLSFLPALLALAFLCGTPGTSVGGPEASAISWGTGVANAPVARGDLTRDVPDDSLGQRADQDDNPDDRTVRLAITIIWPDSALGVSFLDTNDTTGTTHRPCAARPRAPPFA